MALLRGINVGGRNRVAMADLRAVVESLGHGEVATYIQSGNVVFAGREASTSELAVELEEAIAQRLDVRPRVIVLARAELAGIVEANPFPDETDPKRLHAVVRAETFPQPERDALLAALAEARRRGSREDARVVGRTVYLRTPDGLAASELAARLARPAAATTARNWATVAKLLALLDTP